MFFLLFSCSNFLHFLGNTTQNCQALFVRRCPMITFYLSARMPGRLLFLLYNMGSEKSMRYFEIITEYVQNMCMTKNAPDSSDANFHIENSRKHRFFLSGIRKPPRIARSGYKNGCLAGAPFSCISRISPVSTSGVWSTRKLPPQTAYSYPTLSISHLF